MPPFRHDRVHLSQAVLAKRIQQLCQNGQNGKALAEIETSLEAFPACASLHVIHAGVLRHLKHYGSAAGAYAKAAQLDKGDASIWFGMGVCLEEAGEKKGAFQAYAKAVSIEPRHGPAFFRIMATLHKARHHGKLVERLEAAPPDIRKHPRWFLLRASAGLEMGDYSIAQNPPSEHRTIFARDRDAATLRMRAMVYDPEVDAEQILAAAREWDHCFGPETVAGIPPQNPDPNRPFRIGFVNTRMRRHNVGLQQYALMKHRPPRSECTLHLYASNDVDDEITREMEEMADTFTNIAEMDDARALERIRSDALDILIDFNEYANDGRLEIFARRAAPIQVHYYGNALTTGLRAMDYRISDPFSEPPGDSDQWSAERIVRLDCGYHMFTPPAKPAELLSESPALTQGYVTFGAIHHLAKYNDRVLELYRRILEELPTARLLLARQNFEDPLTRTAFLAKLKRCGLPIDRVILYGDHGIIASLAIWNKIDCMLDSFPFSGDATVMDNLYAGVPMITLPGQRLSSRRAASLLHLIGCSELVAKDQDDYVAKAIALGRNTELMSRYRTELHRKVEASPLRRHAEPAAAFYRALREIWKQV